MVAAHTYAVTHQEKRKRRQSEAGRKAFNRRAFFGRMSQIPEPIADEYDDPLPVRIQHSRDGQPFVSMDPGLLFEEPFVDEYIPHLPIPTPYRGNSWLDKIIAEDEEYREPEPVEPEPEPEFEPWPYGRCGGYLRAGEFFYIIPLPGQQCITGTSLSEIKDELQAQGYDREVLNRIDESIMRG